MNTMGKYKSKLFSLTFAAIVVYNTSLFGYGIGVQLSQAVLGSHIQVPPPAPLAEDDSIGVYIPDDYMEISQPPQLVQKVVTIDCVGPDGKHLQVTPEECINLNEAWN